LEIVGGSTALCSSKTRKASQVSCQTHVASPRTRGSRSIRRVCAVTSRLMRSAARAVGQRSGRACRPQREIAQPAGHGRNPTAAARPRQALRGSTQVENAAEISRGDELRRAAPPRATVISLAPARDKTPRVVPLFGRQRPAIGSSGELQQRLQLLRLEARRA